MTIQEKEQQMPVSQLSYTATPYRQFPLRLPAHMADQLDRIAARTRINKTTISRIALQKFIAELERSGADVTLEKVCAI